MCSGREIWHSAAPECQSKFADGMISLDERTDITSPAGELVFHVFGSIPTKVQKVPQELAAFMLYRHAHL